MSSSSSSKYLSLTNLPLFTPLHLSFLFLHLAILVTGDLPPPYVPLDSIALDCGSSSDSIGDDRNWTADINSKVALLDQDSPSTNLTANGASTSSVPYYTARVSLSQFTYTFPVTTTGPKFVRLHFNPASYTGFNRSKASFSVTTGRYTFLSNFSGFHYTDPHGERAGYAREFILNVEDEQKNLSITFTPSPLSARKGRKKEVNCLCVFFWLQVTVIFTVREERKKERSRNRSTLSPGLACSGA